MPSMTQCPQCGHENPAGQSTCIACGAPLPGDKLIDATAGQAMPPPPQRESQPGATKRCPYCAEEIQSAAIVCKHCGRDLGKAPTPAIAGTEFKTLRFPSTPKGQKRKVETLAVETAAGWRIVGETVEQGKFKGGDACCLFVICAPLAFLAGRDPAIITVTLQRESPQLRAEPRLSPQDQAQ